MKTVEELNKFTSFYNVENLKKFIEERFDMRYIFAILFIFVLFNTANCDCDGLIERNGVCNYERTETIEEIACSICWKPIHKIIKNKNTVYYDNMQSWGGDRTTLLFPFNYNPEMFISFDRYSVCNECKEKDDFFLCVKCDGKNV